MCTLTISLQPDRAIVTSNRDVHRERPQAEQPTWRHYQGRELFYPLDTLAGGSWMAHNRAGEIGVLLNGAFQNHPRAEGYLRSRGLVLLDLMAAPDTREEMKNIELIGIEPFTFVFLAEHPREMRWDGKRKFYREYPDRGNFIWSSSTLYDRPMRLRRRHRFEQFLTGVTTPEPERLWHLHGEDRIGPDEGYVIRRPDGVETVARVQWVRQEGRIDHRYT